MEKIQFAIVGAGWRAAFYFQIARALPERFHVCAAVEPDETRAAAAKAAWGVETVPEIGDLKKIAKPDFVVLCLPQAILPEMIRRAVDEGYFVLSETFEAKTPAELESFYRSVSDPARVQVSEQYWYQPIHAARLALLKTGVIGTATQAQIAVGHGYHGTSLIRKYLGIAYENCRIGGKIFRNPIVRGPGRQGYPDHEELIEDQQQFAVFDFGGKWAVFDFTEEQYFSSIRAPRVLVRGERGELENNTVRYLTDFRTPVEYELHRMASGVNGSMGAPHIVGITAADRWYYQNPYGAARLSDDELAVARVLESMGAYVRGGEAFYPLEEGCQDQYLSIMMKKAFATGAAVETETQCWVVPNR